MRTDSSFGVKCFKVDLALSPRSITAVDVVPAVLSCYRDSSASLSHTLHITLTSVTWSAGVSHPLHIPPLHHHPLSTIPICHRWWSLMHHVGLMWMSGIVPVIRTARRSLMMTPTGRMEEIRLGR